MKTSAPTAQTQEIDRLMAQNRRSPSAAAERQLLEARYAAVREATQMGSSSTTDLPVANHDTPLETDFGIPTAPAEGLTGSIVRQGIEQGGCLLVRNMIPMDRVVRLRDCIDSSLEQMAVHEKNSPGNEWYQPFTPEQGLVMAVQRKWAEECGAMLGCDSPRTMFETFDAFDASGLRAVIEDYLGERAACSIKKTVLRKVPIDIPADWHQDGAFMGTGLDSLNVWTSLSQCGSTAPGMDMLPVRLEDIVPTGTEGTHFDWSVSPAMLAQAAGGNPPVRPEFGPGDVVFFDELFMHRTASEPHMTEERYAIETWCFAPSRYPETQIPLLV